MPEPLVRSFLAELAENDGLLVEIGEDGAIAARSRCPHIAPTSRQILGTRDIDALVTATAFCRIPTCLPRMGARAILAQLAALGKAS